MSSPTATSTAPTSADRTDVAAFLASINASSSLEDGASSQPSHTQANKSVPDLPMSATVAMIDAQIDQLHHRILTTVQHNRQTFTQQLQASEKLHFDLNHLYASTLHASTHLSTLPSDISPALHSYNASLVQLTHRQCTIDVVSALLHATLQLEKAETLLSSGDLSALSPRLAILHQSAAPFAAAPKGKHSDLSFLSAAPTPPNPALQELHRRIDQVESALEAVLESAWSRAVTVAKATATDLGPLGAELLVRGTIELSGQAEGHSIALAHLVDVLSERGQLVHLIHSLAAEVLASFVRPILATPTPPVPHIRHDIAETSIQACFALTTAEDVGSATRPIAAVAALFSFIKAHLCDRLDADRSAQVRAILARDLMPQLVPLALSWLDEALPATAQPIDDALQATKDRAAEAWSLERCLRQNGYAATSRAPSEDEDTNDNAYALTRWADDVGSHFSRRIAGHALQRARRLILTHGRGTAADDRSTPPTGGPPLCSMGRKTGAKLGGVRVIKPQDQLGSGPFNTDDVPVDDASWGLDDENDEADVDAEAPAGREEKAEAELNPIGRLRLDAKAVPVEDASWGLDDDDDEIVVGDEVGKKETELVNKQEQGETVKEEEGTVTKEVDPKKVVSVEDASWGLDDDDDVQEEEPMEEHEHEQQEQEQEEQEQKEQEGEEGHVEGHAEGHTEEQEEGQAEEQKEAKGVEQEKEQEEKQEAETSMLVEVVNSEALVDDVDWRLNDVNDDYDVKEDDSGLEKEGSNGDAGWTFDDDDDDNGSPALDTINRRNIVAQEPGQRDEGLEQPEGKRETVEIKEEVAMDEGLNLDVAIELIRLAEEVLADGVRLLQLPRNDIASPPPPSAPVFAAVCDIFDLHRSLMPVAHGDEALRDGPALAMQLAIECDYIAAQLDRIVMGTSPTLGGILEAHGVDILEKLTHQARLTRTLGQRWHDVQMASHNETETPSVARGGEWAGLGGWVGRSWQGQRY